MAELGAIGHVQPPSSTEEVPFPTYAVSSLPERLNRHGALGGHVSEGGTPLTGVLVMVMWRKSGALIGRTFTDANGEWEIGGYDPARTADYVVWIQDLATGAVYNDAIYALVAPAA